MFFFSFEDTCISNILLDAPSCGLRREANVLFLLTEIMPFKFEYNSNIDNISVQNSNLVFLNFTLHCHLDGQHIFSAVL